MANTNIKDPFRPFADIKGVEELGGDSFLKEPVKRVTKSKYDPEMVKSGLTKSPDIQL